MHWTYQNARKICKDFFQQNPLEVSIAHASGEWKIKLVCYVVLSEVKEKGGHTSCILVLARKTLILITKSFKFALSFNVRLHLSAIPFDGRPASPQLHIHRWFKVHPEIGEVHFSEIAFHWGPQPKIWVRVHFQSLLQCYTTAVKLIASKER